MANGYCPSLLRSIEQIGGENAPSRKLNVAGFLAMLFCCQNSSVNPINDGFQDNGQQRGLTVSYRKRPTLSDVQDDDNCDINRIPAKNEWNIPVLGHKQSSFFISDDQISRYCDDFARTVAVGQPATGLMVEHYDLLKEHANIVLKAVNQDLVADMATAFGENVTTGSATGKVINIHRDGDKLILDNGIVDMLRDIQENEICGDPCLVGGGLFSAFNMAQMMACCNSAGIDLSRMGLPRFFFDKDTQSLWGENTVGMFAPGSVKFISRNKYVGNYGGQRGNSFFTTFALPVNDFGCADDCLRDLMFDLQLKYIDCPTEVVVDGQTITVNRGWQAIVSKNYALWVQPTDAYEATDELAGTNGTLKYFFSNTASDAAAYAY